MDEEYFDLNDLLAKVSEHIRVTYAFDGCSMALWQADDGVLVNHYARLPARLHEMENSYRSFRFQPSEAAIAGLTFLRQAPQIIDPDTVTGYSETIQDVYRRWGFMTFAAWPVIMQRDDGTQQTIGVFSAFYENGRVGPELTQEIADRLAGVAETIEAALDQEELEVLDPELAVQHDLLRILTASNLEGSLAASAEPVCAYLMQRFGFDMAGLLAAQGQQLKFRYSSFAGGYATAEAAWQPYAASEFAQDVTDSLTAVVYLQNTRFMVDDVQHMTAGVFPAKDRQRLDALGSVRSFLLLPVRRAGKPVGVLWLMSLAQPVVLGEPEFSTLQLLADFLGSHTICLS